MNRHKQYSLRDFFFQMFYNKEIFLTLKLIENIKLKKENV